MESDESLPAKLHKKTASIAQLEEEAAALAREDLGDHLEGMAIRIVEGHTAEADDEMGLGAILGLRRLADTHAPGRNFGELEPRAAGGHAAQAFGDPAPDLLRVDVADDRDGRPVGADQPLGVA